MGDRLLHDRRIHDHRFDAPVRDHPGLAACLDRLGQQPLHALLADPLAPPRQRGGIEREAVLKERLAAEVLPVGVLRPTGHHGLVRQPIGVLQIQQPRHQPRRCRRSSRVRREEPGPLRLEKLPVDQGRQLHQLVAHVDHVGQTRAQEIVLFGTAGFGLHRSIRNCRVLGQNLPNLAETGHQKTKFRKQNQRVGSCSGRTL